MLERRGLRWLIGRRRRLVVVDAPRGDGDGARRGEAHRDQRRLARVDAAAVDGDDDVARHQLAVAIRRRLGHDDLHARHAAQRGEDDAEGAVLLAKRAVHVARAVGRASLQEVELLGAPLPAAPHRRTHVAALQTRLRAALQHRVERRRRRRRRLGLALVRLLPLLGDRGRRGLHLGRVLLRLRPRRRVRLRWRRLWLRQ